MSDIKIMSFNIRVEADCDGINHQKNRRSRILATLQREAPDLVGFQEASDDARAWLSSVLTEYTLVGCGRLANYTGEGAPLAFRRDRFELIKLECFMLSDTPAIPGSRYEDSDQSGCPRIATAAVLKHRASGECFLYINTHTDHVGVKARILASRDLLAYIKKAGLPTLLTGDFNAEPDSEEIRMLADAMTDVTCGLSGTFHHFGRKEKGVPPDKIDYIFTTLPADPARAYAVADIPDGNGLYTSDHLPVVGFVALSGKEKES